MADVITRQLRQAWITRFDFLGGCLPGRVEPTDIDQALERHGCFLIIECKRPFQSIGRGQEILFDALVRLPGVRVLIVVGQPPDQIEKFAWWRDPLKPGTVGEVRALVREWWEWAGTQ